MPYELTIELTYFSSGPVSATSSADGAFLVVDFQSFDQPANALRLAFPAERLESLIGGLVQIQKSLSDPQSGIHIQNPH